MTPDYSHLTEAEILAAMEENTIALVRALLQLEFTETDKNEAIRKDYM